MTYFSHMKTCEFLSPENPSQLTCTSSNSTIETQEKGVKYIQSEQQKHQSDVNNAAEEKNLFTIFLNCLT